MDKTLEYLQNKRLQNHIHINKGDYYISKLTFVQVLSENNKVEFRVLMKMDFNNGWIKANIKRELERKEFLKTYRRVSEETYLKFLLNIMEKLK